MIMRFRGGGVGHTSTRAATNVFKTDRDILDLESHHGRQEQYAPSNVEEEEGNEDNVMDVEGSVAGEVDEENELSESELDDYGYEREGESESEGDEENRDVGEEDDTTIDELGALGFAEY
jgi:hypothetical protein